MNNMNVEIWSDVACPFCYIGKRHFEKALEQFPHKEKVKVTWKSFQLDPNAKKDQSQNVYEMLAAKYGMTVEQARQANQRVTAMAKNAGLSFDMDNVKLTNTLDAHRLIHLAEKYGQQDEVKERLLQAYFERGESVSDVNTLISIGKQIGLDENEVKETLNSNLYEKEVRDDIRQAQALGISGVPFFVIDDKYGISGAQPVEQMLEVLNNVWQKEHGKISVVSEGESCNADGICKT